MGMDVLISKKPVHQSARRAFPYGKLVAQAFLPVLILERIFHGFQSLFPRRTSPAARGNNRSLTVAARKRAESTGPRPPGGGALAVRLVIGVLATCRMSQTPLGQKPLRCAAGQDR